MSVRIGTKFTSAYADSNAEWKVIGSRGGGAWDCIITENNLDYSGVRKVFGTEEITRAIAFEKAMGKLINKNASWWNERKLGETLHYHNGFGEYVRGVVVLYNGMKQLMPMALVGNWKSRDLPYRREDGTVSYGYQVKKIRFPAPDSCWLPSTSCIWEHPDFVGNPAHKDDPTTMPEIDLSDPPMFIGEEAIKARQIQMTQKINEIISNNRDAPAKALADIAQFMKLEYEPFIASVA